MSILLLGAKFPQNGSPLSCIIKKDCRVFTSYETGTGVIRCDDFTAKELPPHGRLIDADALKKNITANLPVAFQDFSAVLCNIIDMQKTVIGSELER